MPFPGVTTGFEYLSLTPGEWLDSTDPGVAFATARPNARFEIAQVDNDVVLTYVAVPEPTTLTLGAVGIVCIVAAMRRRR